MRWYVPLNVFAHTLFLLSVDAEERTRETRESKSHAKTMRLRRKYYRYFLRHLVEAEVFPIHGRLGSDDES